MKRKINMSNLKSYVIFLILIAMVLFFGIMTPRFFAFSNFMNILRQSAMMGVTAVGVMYILLIGGIDLSVGSQVAFVNILCAFLMARRGWPILPAVLATILCSALSGIVMGLLVTKCKIPPFIATLAFFNILKGVAQTISGGLPITGFPESFKLVGQGAIGPVPVPVAVMIGMFIVGGFILNQTYFGRYLYAIGSNEEAARLSGVPVSAIKCAVYAISSVCACLGGIITLSRLNSGSPQTGNGFEFEVITALVLGGVSISGGYGKISGAIVGVLIMGVLSNGLVMLNIDEYTQTIISGIVLALAVSIDCLQRESAKKKVLISEYQEK